VAWVAGEESERALGAMRGHPRGREAAVIGHVSERGEGELPLVLETRVGGMRPLDLMSGTDLPRIC
jgi:hydrogenase expression/formation protein HypE